MADIESFREDTHRWLEANAPAETHGRVRDVGRAHGLMADAHGGVRRAPRADAVEPVAQVADRAVALGAHVYLGLRRVLPGHLGRAFPEHEQPLELEKTVAEAQARVERAGP